MDNKKTQDALLEAIDIMIEQKIKKLKFNYYVDGVIKTKNTSNTYDVIINGKEYKNVPSKNNFDYSQGDTVQILIKNGDWSKKFIDDKSTHNNTPAKDFVIEEGEKEVTDPNTNLTVAWTYRKWDSGIAECWIRRNVSVNVNSAWGSALFYGTVSTLNFPFQFAEVPVVNVTCEYGTNNNSLFIASCGYSSTNYARPIMLCRTDTRTVNCNLLYQVQGRWK